MTSEISRNASDTGASFGSLLEARGRIRVGDKKVLIPVDLHNRGCRTDSEKTWEITTQSLASSKPFTQISECANQRDPFLRFFDFKIRVIGGSRSPLCYPPL